MAESSYYEQLKHPKWQKKRLQVLERAGFECEYCGASERQLHVHHSYYEKGLAPWDYPDASLHCLCEECHKGAQDRSAILQRCIGRLGLGDIELLVGYALGLEAHSDPEAILDVFSYEVAEGLGDAYGLTPEEVLHSLEESRIDGRRLEELRMATRSGRLADRNKR